MGESRYYRLKAVFLTGSNINLQVKSYGPLIHGDFPLSMSVTCKWRSISQQAFPGYLASNDIDKSLCVEPRRIKGSRLWFGFRIQWLEVMLLVFQCELQDFTGYDPEIIYRLTIAFDRGINDPGMKRKLTIS